MTRLEKCLKIAKRYRATNLLDIGGATGEFTLRLAVATRADRSLCVDKQSGGDISDLQKIDNNSFDFIFAGNMVDILPDPDYLLKEIWRLMTPQGVALLTFPSLDWWLNKVAVVLGFQPYGDRPSTEYNVGKLLIKPHKFSEKNAGYFHYFSRRAFKQLAEFHGFKVKFHTLPLQRYSICTLSLRSSI